MTQGAETSLHRFYTRFLNTYFYSLLAKVPAERLLPATVLRAGDGSEHSHKGPPSRALAGDRPAAASEEHSPT